MFPFNTFSAVVLIDPCFRLVFPPPSQPVNPLARLHLFSHSTLLSLARLHPLSPSEAQGPRPPHKPNTSAINTSISTTPHQVRCDKQTLDILVVPNRIASVGAAQRSAARDCAPASSPAVTCQTEQGARCGVAPSPLCSPITLRGSAACFRRLLAPRCVTMAVTHCTPSPAYGLSPTATLLLLSTLTHNNDGVRSTRPSEVQ